MVYRPHTVRWLLVPDGAAEDDGDGWTEWHAVTAPGRTLCGVGFAAHVNRAERAAGFERVTCPGCLGQAAAPLPA